MVPLHPTLLFSNTNTLCDILTVPSILTESTSWFNCLAFDDATEDTHTRHLGDPGSHTLMRGGKIRTKRLKSAKHEVSDQIFTRMLTAETFFSNPVVVSVAGSDHMYSKLIMYNSSKTLTVCYSVNK